MDINLQSNPNKQDMEKQPKHPLLLLPSLIQLLPEAQWPYYQLKQENVIET